MLPTIRAYCAYGIQCACMVGGVEFLINEDEGIHGDSAGDPSELLADDHTGSLPCYSTLWFRATGGRMLKKRYGLQMLALVCNASLMSCALYITQMSH
jgi:hypothetical protein